MKPLNDKTQGKRSKISETRTLIAPTKGWYVGSPMASSPIGTAFQMENAFPELDYVRIRGGAIETARGMSGPVVDLMTWTDGNTRFLFALNQGKIYDVTAGGLVGAPLVSGLDTLARVSSIQFTGLGVQFLLVANGINPIQSFNGVSWGTDTPITGLTGNQLSYIWTYQSRLYGIEANSLNVWYLGLEAVGGQATIFPLSPQFCRGGKLVAGGVWQELSNAGIIYNWVVISSEGEVLTYTGGFPGSNDWTRTGYYKISKPLGQNCLMPAGGDLAIVTEDGIVPLSKVVSVDQVALQNQAVTLPIAPAWRDAVIARQGLSGWQITIWPLRSMVIINLPQMGVSDRTQFVTNARTGSWCRYVGWDSTCWAVSGVGIGVSGLYYGTSDGRVMQAEVGGQDDGKAYTMTIFTSYNDLSATDIGFQSFGQSSARKRIVMARPRLQTNFLLNPKTSINVDFDVTIPSAPAPQALVAVAGAQWDVARWNVGTWPAPSLTQQQQWVPVFADAAVIGLILQVSIQTPVNPDIRLTSSEVLYETGNVFG